MKIAIASFTSRGAKSAEIIREKAKDLNWEIIEEYQIYAKEKLSQKESLSVWTKRLFKSCDSFLFIGAAGIAVRSIAPYLVDKFTDPAVVVVDEKMQYAISLLSGHVGGGNQFCLELAKLIDAIPVITTATDLNQKFPVDVYATKRKLFISDRILAKEASSLILEGNTICFLLEKGFEQEEHYLQKFPELNVLQEDQCPKITETTFGIRLGIFQKHRFLQQLNLIPKVIHLGIGCKKNTTLKEIEELVEEWTNHLQLDSRAIVSIASIELKKEEKGLLDFAKKMQLPIFFYSLEQLEQVKEVSRESEFVKKITGVGNVCERSALFSASKEGKVARLLLTKQAKNGVTLSLAVEEWRESK